MIAGLFRFDSLAIGSVGTQGRSSFGINVPVSPIWIAYLAVSVAAPSAISDHIDVGARASAAYPAHIQLWIRGPMVVSVPVECVVFVSVMSSVFEDGGKEQRGRRKEGFL